MRPVGLFGLLTMTARVLGVMAAAMRSGSRSKSGGVSRTRTGVAPAEAIEQLVEEPRRREEDDLVADIAERPDRHPEAPEGTRGHRDGVGVEGDAGPPPKRLGDDVSRLRLAELVGEPVLVLGFRVPLERVDQPGEWELLRVAEREVGDPRSRPMPLPQSLVQPGEDRADARDHPVHPTFDVAHSQRDLAWRAASDRRRLPEP